MSSPPPATFDRTAEDIGNVVQLGHVNVQVRDHHLATLFYVTALGLTRDPYLNTGVDNMWVNAGHQQFHLPRRGDPQVLRGRVGLVLPSRTRLLQRLSEAQPRLAETTFAFAEHEDHVAVTCPWGNRFRCHEPDARRFGPIQLGIPYVEFDVPPGSLQGIARFYQEMFQVRAEVLQDDQGPYVKVPVGLWQALRFRETSAPLAAYDGHHIQIYVHGFSGIHGRLCERGLVFEESNRWQYRFRDIVDLGTGRVLFTIEHEVNSMTHPLFGRPLVNRSPEQTTRHYAPGLDAAQWGMGLDEA